MVHIFTVNGKFGIVCAQKYAKNLILGFKHRTSRMKIVRDEELQLKNHLDEEYQDDLYHATHLLHCGDIFCSAFNWLARKFTD